MGSSGGGVKAPVQQTVEDPQVIVEDEDEVKKKKQASVQNMGRQQNLLSGLQSVLKKRLGE